VVGGDGRVALWCRTCFARRDELLASAVAPPVEIPRRVAAGERPRRVSAIEMPEATRSRRPVLLGAALVATASAAIAVAVVGSSGPAPAPTPPVTVAAQEVHAPAAPTPPTPAAAPVEPAEPAAAAADEGTADPDAPLADPAAVDLAALVEERPSLSDWVHPVTGSDEPIPVRGTRKYGARREGLSRTLCGLGHCGVDLSGPRGRPVVAVAWGTVVRVEHSARGRDGRSGRYVRLEHPEGVFTSYMHLDAIEAEISVGDEVEAGTVLGTLGKTAIYNGEQHLHFGLEIEDHGALVYIDPTPFLAGAQVMPIPDRPLQLTPPDEREQW
jgi:murein DD-endopeptidase MepM/ murein hydrolase activator NlpD